MNVVPEIRVRCLNERPTKPDGQFVLYWMTAYRRLNHNFALQRAVEWCMKLNRPLLILEALRCDYPWASDRLHQFVLEGMRDNFLAAGSLDACYFPYMEPDRGQGSGLFQALANKSCMVVSDDFPCFFLPRMTKAAARHCPVSFELVDSNGLLPMRSASDVFPTAYAFRRFLQKTLADHLEELPAADPFAGIRLPRLSSIPEDISQRWPPLSEHSLQNPRALVSHLPIDHRVGAGAVSGGARSAAARLTAFCDSQLERYAESRNQPDEDVASGLSPWLHFGHISVHQIFERLAQLQDWSPSNLGDVRQTKGSRQGWWGMSDTCEAFLDELVTWRELGFNMCWQRSDYDQYESLPDWAQETLQQHSSDPRPFVYSLEQLQSGKTHDRIWNAAQNQLAVEGRMHNYLRMLWGKKILEWSDSPREALRVMIELNNRYALDGRNPNSYSGIFWVLGRYDRPWGPERAIFGKIRYMSSDNTARKLHLKKYLDRFAPDPQQGKLF